MSAAEPTVRGCRIPAEARLRGSKIGGAVAAERRRAAAWDNDDANWPLIFLLRAEGQSLQAIADEFTREGFWTRRGVRRWHPAQVQRIIDRTLDRAAEIADDMEEDLRSLRAVYRRERGGEIPALPDEDDETEGGDVGADAGNPTFP
ncbi:MAG TPA: recombinase family protein [Gemmataceae bacterium]|nr:recombinase family protein [Gemmataceae bacterium]